MRDNMTRHERKNTQLIAILDEVLRQRPELLEEIPSGVSLVMQVEEDEEFNAWAYQIAEKNNPDRPKLLVRFTFKTPVKPTEKRPLSWEQVEEMQLQRA